MGASIFQFEQSATGEELLGCCSESGKRSKLCVCCRFDSRVEGLPVLLMLMDVEQSPSIVTG